MSGLLRRLTRRPATADENRSPATASSDTAATPATAGGEQPLPAPDDQPTQVLQATGDPVTREWAVGPTGWSGPASAEPTAERVTTVPIAGQFPERPTDRTAPEAAHARDLPAGVDPAELAHAPASARRGRLRRRLRYLRSVRELLLRDLGGFTYEVHRTASGEREKAHDRLQRAKAERIAALDAEVRALETRLGEPHATTTLREAGIGGTCPECGELHASDAHFCARCGAPLDAKARARREAATAPEESRPATGLWAGVLRRKPAEPERPADAPAAVTGEWLGSGDQPTTFDRAAGPGHDAKAKADDDARGNVAAGDTTAAAPGERDAAAAAPGEGAAASDDDRTVREHEATPRADGDAVTFVEGRREQG